MLTIILGILASFAVGFGIAMYSDRLDIASTITLLGIMGSLYAGLHLPLSGYTNWEMVQGTELVSLSNSTVSGGEGLVYVSLSADNAYTYRYEIDSEFGTETSKEYKIATILSETVEEVEDPNCEIPVLRIYTIKEKKSVWTFGLGLEEKNMFFMYLKEPFRGKLSSIKVKKHCWQKVNTKRVHFFYTA